MMYVVTVRRDEIPDFDDALGACANAARGQYPPPEDCRFWWVPRGELVEFIFRDHGAAIRSILYFRSVVGTLPGYSQR
jgi:hypothetical protein